MKTVELSVSQPQGGSRATHRRGSLGGAADRKRLHCCKRDLTGDAVTFDQFWFKMANVVRSLLNVPNLAAAL